MANPTIQSNRLQLGAGKLYVAPLGTITDSYAPTATGGVFTLGTTSNQVPGSSAWLPLGSTVKGSEIDYTITTADVEVAESYDAVKIITTKRVASLIAELAQLNLTNYDVAFNSLGATGWNGTPGTTGVAKFSPPNIGQEVRAQLLYISLDSTMVSVFYQVLNTGSIKEVFNKGATYATLACTFTAEIPPTAVAAHPMNVYVTGTGWAATLYNE